MRARVLGCAPSGKVVPKIYDLSLAIGELTMYCTLQLLPLAQMVRSANVAVLITPESLDRASSRVP